MTNSNAWDEALRILRDPIFGLVVSVFLALIGSRNIRRLAGLVCWLASIVLLIWLAAHNASSARVEVAVVTAVTRVLLVCLAALVVIAIIAMAILLVMYLQSAPPSSLLARQSGLHVRSPLSGSEPSGPGALALSEPGTSPAADDAREIMQGEGERFADHLETMVGLLDGLFSSADDGGNLLHACGRLLRIYFSGLSAHSAEIAKIHGECDAGVKRLAKLLAQDSYTVRLPLAEMSRRNWFPHAHEWAAVAEHSDFGLPYPAMRAICLKADWRAVTMIMYKSYACLAILMEMAER